MLTWQPVMDAVKSGAKGLIYWDYLAAINNPEFDQNSCVELSPLLDSCGTEESKETMSPSSSV